MKYWYFSELSCDKKNLKWIFISYGIYETRCAFYIPSPKARDIKRTTRFINTVWNENLFQILYLWHSAGEHFDRPRSRSSSMTSLVTSRRWRVYRSKIDKKTRFSHVFCGFKHVIERILNEFSLHTVFIKLVVCFISPRQRLGDIKTHNSFNKYRKRRGDIKHTACFINTVWNENSFQILYLWNSYISLHKPRNMW